MAGQNQGVNALARVLSDRMKKENKQEVLLDFGVIKENFSLRTDTFPVDIPKGGYTICRGLTIRYEEAAPEKLRGIRPGDRVLVAWVQKEAVVIDIVVSTASL